MKMITRFFKQEESWRIIALTIAVIGCQQLLVGTLSLSGTDGNPVGIIHGLLLCSIGMTFVIFGTGAAFENEEPNQNDRVVSAPTVQVGAQDNSPSHSAV